MNPNQTESRFNTIGTSFDFVGSTEMNSLKN